MPPQQLGSTNKSGHQFSQDMSDTDSRVSISSAGLAIILMWEESYGDGVSGCSALIVPDFGLPRSLGACQQRRWCCLTSHPEFVIVVHTKWLEHL